MCYFKNKDCTNLHDSTHGPVTLPHQISQMVQSFMPVSGDEHLAIYFEQLLRINLAV